VNSKLFIIIRIHFLNFEIDEELQYFVKKNLDINNRSKWSCNFNI